MADVKVLKTTILLRRATQAQWDAIAGTFIPKAGEPCVTLDGKNKGQIKIGDGTTPWGELKYAGVVEGALNFKGSVQTKAELPEVANVGDIYQVIEDSTMYIWDGDSWEIFHAIDLTGYATKEEVNALKNEINEELNKYALKTDLDVIKIYGDSVAEDTSMSVDGVKYDTASEAINAVPDGGTVKMSGGLGVGDVINVDKKLTLDMNNAVIIDNEKTPVVVGVNGDLTLSGDGSVECNKNGKPAISNNGTLTIENGNITRTVDEKGNTYYTMVNHGNATINGGIFQAPREISSMIENGYWDYNSGNEKSGYIAGVNSQYPELTINGGTFINAFYAIKNDDASKLTINDGMFYGTILHNGIEMIINGGHFTTTDGFYPLSIRNLSDDLNPAKTVINGGIFDGNCKTIIKNSGEKELDIQVKGGKFILPVEAQYIAEGYEQKLVNGYYEVTKKA